MKTYHYTTRQGTLINLKRVNTVQDNMDTLMVYLDGSNQASVHGEDMTPFLEALKKSLTEENWD